MRNTGPIVTQEDALKYFETIHPGFRKIGSEPTHGLIYTRRIRNS